MALIQERSEAAPLTRSDLLAGTLGLVRRARAMGLLTEPRVERLDLALVRRIATAAAEQGIGSDAAAALAGSRPAPVRLAGLIGQLGEALEASPLPGLELPELAVTFDLETLGRLVGASPVSLRRYLAGTRTPPDDTAARIHWLALVTGDLRGAYNPTGVRRWFERPRSALAGRSPGDVLVGPWDPDDSEVRTVRALAEALAVPGAAT
jgi:hypothetical protein